MISNVADFGSYVESIRCITVPNKQTLLYNWHRPCEYNNVGIHAGRQNGTERVYPNPFGEVLNLEFNAGVLPKMIAITSLSGQQVFESAIDKEDNQLHLEYLPSGPNLLKVYYRDVEEIHKVLKY